MYLNRTAYSLACNGEEREIGHDMQQGQRDAAKGSDSDGEHAPPGDISKLMYVLFF